MFLLPLPVGAVIPEGSPAGEEPARARYELKLEAPRGQQLELTGQGSYLPGQQVLITARPVEDARFGSWSLNGTLFSRQDTIHFIMPDMDITLEALTPRQSRRHQRQMKRTQTSCNQSIK